MTMQIKQSRVADSLNAILKNAPRTVTRAIFWKIAHNSDTEDIRLKVGRYNKATVDNPETPECEKPKSELTLDKEEFQNLIKFISENYEPFRHGIKNFISLDASLSADTIAFIQAIFSDPDRERVLSIIAENNILPHELLNGIEHNRRLRAITTFEEMLSQNLLESQWQRWFQENNWVLGTDFVRILEERSIDTGNISDFLMEAYDGFLDIIEIKRPEGSLNFWSAALDHDNYVPSTDLVKAVTQATRYIYEVERRSNDLEFTERTDNVKTVKPRCILIFGRSNDWNDEQRKAFRILNASFHNLSIMTYDHVLSRAKRMLAVE